MEVLKTGAVAHADKCDTGPLSLAVQMRLRRQITCGRCLVQNGQSRPRQQQPRKGQALLLPLREDGGPVTRRVQGRVPRDIGCEAVQDAPQIDTLEHGLQFGIGGGRSGGRARGGRRGLCGGRGFGGRSSGGLGPRGIQQLFAECAQDLQNAVDSGGIDWNDKHRKSPASKCKIGMLGQSTTKPEKSASLFSNVEQKDQKW